MESRNSKKRVIYLVIVTLIFLLTKSMAQQVSVSPARLTFLGEPGQTVSQTVLVSNGGESDFDFTTSLKDWNRDSLGNKVYYPSSSLKLSNAAQIRLSETNFIVKPKQRKTVTVYFEIPKNGNSSTATNSMLFLTQTNPALQKNTENNGLGIKIGYEFGIQVFYNPGDAKKGELEFESFEYQKSRDTLSPSMLTVGYFNSGEINKSGQLRMELTNKETGEEIKLTNSPMAIMPLAHQFIQVPLPKDLPSGEYLAVGLMDSGAGYKLKVAEKSFHVE